MKRIIVATGLLTIGQGAGDEWRAVWRGAAFGLASHLVRDLATGGVRIWRPLSDRRLTMPTRTYRVLVIGAIGLAVAQHEVHGGWRSKLACALSLQPILGA